MLGVVRRNPEFRRLWLAQVVSEAGDWLNRMAVLSLIGRLGGGAELGVLFGAELVTRLLPTALMGPLAGPVADRLPRRFLMVAADLLRAAVVLGFLLVEDEGDVPLLYTLLVLQMSVGIFFQAARSASVPRTVPKDELHEAYALSAATWSTMLSIGALAGGLLVAWVGPRGVFLADAATYVVSACLLIGLRLGAPPEHPEPFRISRILLLTDMRDGLAHVRSLGLTFAVLAKAFWGGAGGYLVLLALAGNVRFGDGASAGNGGAGDPGDVAAVGTAIGLLYFARGIGTGVGPVLARRWFGSGDAALRRQVAGGFLVGALGYLCFAPTESLALAVLCVVFAHSGGSTLWVGSTILWQRHVDDRFRGRVYALEFLAMTLSFALGGFLTGELYDRLGSITESVVVVSLVVLACGAAWTLLSRRASRGGTSPAGAEALE